MNMTRTNKVIDVLPRGYHSAPVEVPARPWKYRAISKRKRTSDYLDYDDCMLKGKELLLNDKTCIFGFYIILSVNLGTRYGDTTRIRHSDLEGLTAGDYLSVREQKTGRLREIQLNARVIDAYTYLRQRLVATGRLRPTGYIFTSNKGTIYRVISMNRLLKEHFAGYTKQISTHSLRKSFGRRVYENSGRSEDALIKLSEVFQHASMSTTRKYLGLRREELDNLYMTL